MINKRKTVLTTPLIFILLISSLSFSFDLNIVNNVYADDTKYHVNINATYHGGAYKYDNGTYVKFPTTNNGTVVNWVYDHPDGYEFRGFIQFNITNLPRNMNVTEITLRYYGRTYQPDTNISTIDEWHFAPKNDLFNASHLFNSIGNGTVMYADGINGTFPNDTSYTVQYEADLGNKGRIDFMQHIINYVNWYDMGFYIPSGITWCQMYGVMIGQWFEGMNRVPQLHIEFTLLDEFPEPPEDTWDIEEDPIDIGGGDPINVTDPDIKDYNLTETPSMFFYQFSIPEHEGSKVAKIDNITVTIGNDYDGQLRLSLFLASDTYYTKYKPISESNPAILRMTKAWNYVDKGVYFIEPSLSVNYGRTVAIGVSGTREGLEINQTDRYRQLFIINQPNPFTITEYDLFDNNSSIALTMYLTYQVLTNEYDVEPDDDFVYEPPPNISGEDVYNNLLNLRDSFGMPSDAGGLLMALILTFIVLFLVMYMGARFNQQVPTFIYAGAFVFITSFNVYLGFLERWVIIVIIFIVAIMGVWGFRTITGGSNNQ